MFNSKAFCVILFLTAAVLGAAIYFQAMEMMEYKLLAKLDKQYLGGTFTGSGGTTKPTADAAPAKTDDKAKEAAAPAKKDDKK